MDEPYPGGCVFKASSLRVRASRRAQLARSVQPLLAASLRGIVWQLGRPQASANSRGPEGTGRRGRRDTIGLHRGRGVSDFWPDFFLLAGPAGSSGRARMPVDISVWGGLCPGFWARPQQTSTDPVKCECVATAHCVHPLPPPIPSIAHRCGLAFAADVLTVEAPACSLRLPAYGFGGLPWMPRSCGRRGRLDDERAVRTPRQRSRALEMIMAVGRRNGSLSLSSLGRPLLVNSAIPDSVVREALQKKPIVPALSLELSSRSLK